MSADPVPLDYHRKEHWRFRPWVKCAFWLALLALAVYAWRQIPTGMSSHGRICHICGRVELRESFYVAEIKLRTRTRVVDGDATRLYEGLIGEPHAHDWHKAGFTTHHGGHGVPGDADDRIPSHAVLYIHEHLRGLDVEERRAVYRRIVTGSRRSEDVSTKFDTELKALRARSKVPVP